MVENAIEGLQELGFSQYEAQAFVSLLQRNPVTGYELAKISGIPRANIYKILRKLEERGAVVRLDSEEGTRYSPVAPEELIHGLRSHLQSSLDEAQDALCQLSATAEPERVWNAQGYPALLEHAKALMDSAQCRIMVATWPQESAAVSEDIERAQQRGIDVKTLCLAGCSHECGNCRGEVYRYKITPQQTTRSFLVVQDESEVLAGEIGPGEHEALSVRTRQRLLVDLAVSHIRNSIALAALLVDLGEEIENLLTPEARSILQSIGPEGEKTGWLEHLRQLLGTAKKPSVAG
jgi:DNA-binding MarR family transcriptional regulator